MNQETLAIYAQDLSSYEIDDIAAVLEDMGKEAPQDFKQLWPAIGTMLEAIRGRIRARKPSAEQEAAAKWNQYLEACKAEGIEAPDPEMAARIAKLNARISMPSKTRCTCNDTYEVGSGARCPIHEAA